MVEHTDESRPSRTMAIERTRARVTARFGPETLVVDHGMVYVSEHLNSVCRRMGISYRSSSPL